MIRQLFAAAVPVFMLLLCSSAEAQRDKKDDSDGDSKDTVSFVKEVAPIIEAKCGRCHVSSARGRYNIKSYDALMNSDSIVAGKPDESYFVEVIENGEMPKGGLKVGRKELQTIKKWITQGAKFDGDDESQAVNTFGKSSASSNRSRARDGRSTQSRSAAGRSPSRSRSQTRQTSKPNAIKSNKLLAFFDQNGDGKLSLSEIDAAKRLLYSLDANEDDRLTGDEVEEFGKR